MPWILESHKQKLRDLFASELEAEVTTLLFIRPESSLFIPGRQPTTSREARELMQEVADLSDKLQLEVHDVTTEPELTSQYRADKLPALLLQGPQGPTVRFFGLPAGYEFSALVADLIDVSKQRVDLSEQTLQELAALPQDVHLQVFVTPT